MSPNRSVLTYIGCHLKYLLKTFEHSTTLIQRLFLPKHSKWTAEISETKVLRTNLAAKQLKFSKNYKLKHFRLSQTHEPMILSNLMWRTRNSLTRDLYSRAFPVFQKQSGDNKGKGVGENGISNDTESTEPLNKAYNPKNDSFFTQDPAFGSKENKGSGEAQRPVFHPEENSKLESEDLSPPTNCCQSGCPNCVWIEYVEKLTQKYTDPNMSREKVLQELDSLEDQNIKAFIMMELRVRKLI